MKAILTITILAWMALGCTNCESTAQAGPPVSGELVLVQFTVDVGLQGWKATDGGFAVNEAGNAVFSGGAGAAIQCDFNPVEVAPYGSLVLGLKGDGRSYQLSLQPGRDATPVCVAGFQTRGEWETVEIPFADMRPAFPGPTLARLQIRAGDGSGPFRLEIDRIWLK